MGSIKLTYYKEKYPLRTPKTKFSAQRRCLCPLEGHRAGNTGQKTEDRGWGRREREERWVETRSTRPTGKWQFLKVKGETL